MSIIFNILTKEVKVFKESTNDDQILTFNCTPGSSFYSFIEVFLKSPPTVVIKSHEGKFYMTTVFLDLNDKKYIINFLTYNRTTKLYKIDLEGVKTRE